MNLDDFRKKWKNDIKIGIVSISEDENLIVADRFDYETHDFLCERKHLNKIQADIRRLGYTRITIGRYSRTGYLPFISNILPQLKKTPHYE